MGMFDHVIFEIQPFPELGKNTIYQTKSFGDEHLGTYKITKDGELLYRDVTYEPNPIEERNKWGLPFVKEKEVKWIPFNKTIEILCYTTDDKNEFWYEIELEIYRGIVKLTKKNVRSIRDNQEDKT